MTSTQLFDSLQYLDDALLAEQPRRAAPRWPVWAAAACLALAVVGTALLNGPRRVTEGAHTDLPTHSSVQGAGTPAARPVQPVGVPGPGAATPERIALVWNEAQSAATVDWNVQEGVVEVGDLLTEEEMAACAPEIRLEWMAQTEGNAVYYLAGGKGGLAYVLLRFTDPAHSGVTATLRDVDAPRAPVCGLAFSETDRVGALNGLEYRAYRHPYLFGEVDRLAPWVTLTVVFEKENVEYTLQTDVLQSEEDAAAQDMADLLLAYAGSHTVPDLAAFRYRGSLDDLS